METALHATVSSLLSPTSLTLLLSYSDLLYYESTHPRPLSISVSKLFPGSFHLLTQADSLLVHPNLMRAELHQEIEAEGNTYLLSVQEYTGTLLYRDMEMRRERGRPYGDEALRLFICQIAGALQHLKKHGLAHGSVSPLSIFVKQNSAALGDFCTLKMLPSQFDVYSLGMTALQMLIVTNGGAYRTDPPSAGEITLFLGSFKISTLLKDVLNGMLQLDPNVRLSSEKVLSMLQQSCKSLIYFSISTISSSDSSYAPCVSCGRKYEMLLPVCQHGICRQCAEVMRGKKRRCPLCGVKVAKSFFSGGISTKSCPLCPML